MLNHNPMLDQPSATFRDRPQTKLLHHVLCCQRHLLPLLLIAKEKQKIPFHPRLAPSWNSYMGALCLPRESHQAV